MDISILFLLYFPFYVWLSGPELPKSFHCTSLFLADCGITSALNIVVLGLASRLRFNSLSKMVSVSYYYFECKCIGTSTLSVLCQIGIYVYFFLSVA